MGPQWILPIMTWGRRDASHFVDKWESSTYPKSHSPARWQSPDPDFDVLPSIVSNHCEIDISKMSKIHKLQQIWLKLIPWLALEYIEAQRKPQQQVLQTPQRVLKTQTKMSHVNHFCLNHFSNEISPTCLRYQRVKWHSPRGQEWRPLCAWSNPGCEESTAKPTFMCSISRQYSPALTSFVPRW